MLLKHATLMLIHEFMDAGVYQHLYGHVPVVQVHGKVTSTFALTTSETLHGNDGSSS